MKMKKTFLFPMIVLGSLLMMAACTESFEDRCRREAREYTERMCPRVIAEYTMIDSMVFVEKPIGFTYYYNVSGPLDDPELMTDDVIEEFRNELLRNLRQDINLKRYKERGLTFTYIYVSATTQEHLAEATLGPEDYN